MNKLLLTAGYLKKAVKAIMLLVLLGFCGCAQALLDSLVGGEPLVVANVEVLESRPRFFISGTPPVGAGASSVTLSPNESAAVPTLEAVQFRYHPAHEGEINDLVVSRDGMRAFSAGADGKVVESTVVAGAGGETRIRRIDLLQSSRPVLALALSPDERKLALSQTSSVLIFDLDEQTFTNELTIIKGRITALAWDPLGELLVLGRSNGDVFGWRLLKGRAPGRNSHEAIEEYRAAKSPIVAIVFHPTARAFFAAEANGAISLWRLLRAERDIGLRDEQAVVDQEQRARERDTVSVGGGRGIGGVDATEDEDDIEEIVAATDSGGGVARVEDIWLSTDGLTLFASASNGTLYPVKVRGLVPLPPVSVAAELLASVTGWEPGGGQPAILAVSQRVNRVSFICDGQTRGGKVIAQSPLFKNPLKELRIGSSSTTLWASEKTGNLVRFDVRQLLNLPEVRDSMQSCGA